MRLFLPDPSEEDEPETIGQLHDRLPVGEWVEAYGVRVKRLTSEPIADHVDQQAPMESSVRTCVICGKPTKDSPECPACEDREWRKWER